MIEFCKLQIGCLLVIFYLGALLVVQEKILTKIKCNKIFDVLFILGEVCVLCDGITAYTVNHLDVVSDTFNKIMHVFFYLTLSGFMYLLVFYILSITRGLPKSKIWKHLFFIPFVIVAFFMIYFINDVEFRIGKYTNYSMGSSVYFCFATIVICHFIILSVLFSRIRYIQSTKRISIFTCLIAAGVITILQLIYPEILSSSLAVLFILLGISLNEENPAEKQLNYYHSEMVTGFSTLVENRDGNTGGHIRRTTAYVKLIANELINQKKHLNILTLDYLTSLIKAAPMHDIGKIGIPDAILQKPGKLTDEEFNVMKTHTEKGGEIIQKTFGHLNDKEYEEIAFTVARYHHERWDGTGYPEGLKKTEIPLCARIMAVADVFDALSADRCYRKAMPLNICFDIIKEGRGKNFDPEITDLFLSIKPAVKKIFNEK